MLQGQRVTCWDNGELGGRRSGKRRVLNGLAKKFLAEPESAGDPLGSILSKVVTCPHCNLGEIALSSG